MPDPRMLPMLSLIVMLATHGSPASDAEIPESVRMDGIAAYVNGETITLSDVIRSNRTLQGLFASGAKSAELNAAYRGVLEKLIATELVVAAYEAQTKMQIPESAIDDRLDMIVEEQFNGDRVVLAEALTREGLSLESWREQVREGIILQSMRAQHVERHVRVSPAEVKAAFAARKDALSSPARARLRMIVLPLDGGGAEKLAALRERILAGEDFSALAQEFSTDAYAAKGGLRGWMDLPDLRVELRGAISGLEPGGLSDVTLAGSKSYLIQLEELVEGEAADFDAAASLLERELRAEAADRLFKAWIDSLRRTSYVRIVEEAPF